MDFNLRAQLATHLDGYDKRRAERISSTAVDGRDGDKIAKQQQQQQQATSLDRIAYGTAGFRGDAGQIEHLFFNVGLISGLRCLQLKGNVGVMVTASHNPVQDNGVKLIDCNGEMLESQWEPIVEEFCNTHGNDQLLDKLESLIAELKIDFFKDSSQQQQQPMKVMIGIDTRPSSEALANLVKQGLNVWSPLVQFVYYGLLTTPALHYLVAESNKSHHIKPEPTLLDYYEQLISGLEKTFSRPIHDNYLPSSSAKSLYSSTELVIDCANGVGSETMQYFCNNETFNKYLPVKLINTGDGILNKLCGADYVKTVQLPPSGANDIEKRYASLDGDADRVVYFYLEKNPLGDNLKLKLLDGDKIMALYAIYLKELLKRAMLDQELSLGIVQTAYANGASTDYLIKNLGLNVDCVDTGVKNLHKQALHYDLGIYFEANGHGTIWISPKARSVVGEQNSAELKDLFTIINNYTGDAISDILVAETILRYYNWDIKQWYSLYQDRPNSLIKVQVEDRNKIKTTNAARTCIEPKGLQAEIDNLVGQFGPEARCFVRPSGTENVVRIYAEAKDQTSADSLALKVGDLAFLK